MDGFAVTQMTLENKATHTFPYQIQHKTLDSVWLSMYYQSMDYIKKTVSLPKDLNDLLLKEQNQSNTVTEALKLFFKHKETAKRLVTLAEKLEVRLEKLDTIQTHTVVRQQVVDDGPAVVTNFEGDSEVDVFDPIFGSLDPKVLVVNNMGVFDKITGERIDEPTPEMVAELTRRGQTR